MSTRLRVGQPGLSYRDNRAALLGESSAPSSGRSSPFYDVSNEYSRRRTAEELESQNDEQLEGLSAKVKQLKQVTIAIGAEVKDSTIQLTQMNDAFAETGGILSGTFRRLQNMSSRQGCRWLWYMVFLIIVFWFFIVVWWFRR
ncbi:hypothetical protein SISNIDRAFT_454422 [Sistotremastrum niveocremeum HHB9708]|uniref:t-SNARE coiled-coil homology domain-containing protein n=2 Tax=Sistotremastraceae TaxID=3402574 RepID=A0A164UJ38_9AGAM|nr:hypothetical protein SISNIDRAFT_454422 [Sistotremastrum niveocremeum HHB9708]KZT43921.1 hypothetical protein SISSUDRAFT_1039845 [Sistotremastrum suecicum HHB10207 ss-3]